MAQLSTSQKKQKKTFIVLLVAIVVVLAAIAYIVYGEATSHSSLFEDQKFAAAIAKDLGTAPSFLKESDLAAVKYLGVTYDGSETVQVITGGDEFVDKYSEYLAKDEAGEDVSSYDFSNLVKGTTYTYKGDQAPTLDELKYFTGVRHVEVSGINVTDSSVFEGMTEIERGSFTSCGLTEVAGFAGLDGEKLIKLVLNGNNVEDWSPLDAFADKVIVSMAYSIVPKEDGTVDSSSLILKETTLTEYYEEQAAEDDIAAGNDEENTADNADENADTADENADNTDANTDTAGDNADNTDAPAENADEAGDNADVPADNADEADDTVG